MGLLRIAEFTHLARDHVGEILQVPMMPPRRELVLPIEFEPCVSEPLLLQTTFVELIADEDCAVAFGLEPEVDGRKGIVWKRERVLRGVAPGHRVACVLAVKG